MIGSTWLFEGQPWSDSEMKYVKGSLASSILNSFNTYPQLKALVVYEADGARVEKSFSELQADVARILSQIDRALSPDQSRVALIGENSYLFVLHFLALLFRNSEIALLHPREPLEVIENRLKSLGDNWIALKDANLIVSSNLSDRYLNFFDLSDERHRPIGRKPPNFEGIRVRVFTSGTTGSSKIVQQSERSIIANVDALIERHRLHLHKTVIATPLPLFHVNALEFVLLTCLTTGGCCIIYSSPDWKTIVPSLNTDQVECLSLFPTLVQQFLKMLSGKHALPVPSLKYVVTAASSLPHELAENWFNKLSIPLVQGYGLSEAVNFSCLNDPFDSQEKLKFWMCQASERPSIGFPLRGNDVHILKPDGSTASEGEVGEVAIRGWNVMETYQGQEKDDLFQDGFLHTGDLGYFLNDPQSDRRYFFLSGRLKDVIKRNGETISLREADEALQKCLESLNLTGICVGFDNIYSGEEIGAVICSENRIPDEILSSAIEKISSILRPRVVLFTKSTLSTASGKPIRWKFKSEFEVYRSALIGKNVRIEQRGE